MTVVEPEIINQPVTELLIQLGLTYLEKGDFNSSIEKLKQAIDLGETTARVYLNLSKAYILKEQFDEESRQIFEKSLQFEPQNPVLNIVLSQLYLDAGREDELALTVFRTALKHHPQNSDQISSRLIKIAFQQEKIDVVRELMQQFVDQPEKVSAWLPLYILNEWKQQGFSHVTQYLKKAIKAQPHPPLYRWLLVNLWQAERQASAPPGLTPDEIDLCYRYLKSITSFERLLDIYLYPAMERMLTKYANKTPEPAPTGIEEYEIFLSENALSNIWERGLNKNTNSPHEMVWQEGELWHKLKPWSVADRSLNRITAPGETPIDEIFNQAETILIIHALGATTQELSEKLIKFLSPATDLENMLISGFSSEDGVILFWRDINSPLRLAANFIQNLSQSAMSKTDNQSQFQFSIHKVTRRGKDRQKSLANDLWVALATLELERELFFHENQREFLAQNPGHQVLITAALKEKINGEMPFSLEPLERSIQHPTTDKSIPLFQLTWDDPLADIRQGKIQEIGRFKLLKELNQNPAFITFKAIDIFLDRLVVVKILNPNFKIASRQISTLDLFLQEAKILGKLSHPNVAMIYDFGNEQNICYLAREFVEGMPLTIQRSINNKINIKRTVKICLDIAQTLNSIHEQKICHGRLQPDNIFLMNGDDIKITDFQLASFAGLFKLFNSASLKQFTYVAPELIAHNHFDHLSDIFSLGAIMYDLLASHNPFFDSDPTKIFDNILNKTPQPPSFYNSELPEQLDHLILKALDKAPEKRFQNMGELEEALALLL